MTDPVEKSEVFPRESAAYLLFMLLASVMALALLGVEAIVESDTSTRSILGYADLVLCGLFFTDFLTSLVRAKNKRHYLLTWGWLDLLSSIPIIEPLRWGRAARIVRIIRLLRGLRSAKILAQFLWQQRAQSAVMAASLLVVVLVTAGSVMILHVERPFGELANIRTAEDAVWWSVVTITTVGYGDKYPVSTEGRLIAAVLMIAGVGMFATLSGLLATLFLTPYESKHDSEVESLRQDIRELRLLIHKLIEDKPQDGHKQGPPERNQ